MSLSDSKATDPQSDDEQEGKEKQRIVVARPDYKNQ
jgi:hypothetical protein